MEFSIVCSLISMLHLTLQVLGDMVESIVGAVLVDTGFDMNYVWNIMLSFLDTIMSYSGFQLSPIRDIKEFCQSCGWKLQFHASEEPKSYSVEAEVKGNNFHATASAVNRSKKHAEKIAANLILTKLKVYEYKHASTVLLCQRIICILFLYHMLVDP